MATTDERRAFGQRLRALREERDWSLDRLAEELKNAEAPTTAANIGAWERGQYAPRNRSTIAALSRVLGTDELAGLLGITLAHPAEPIQMSASGANLAELREKDPEYFAQLEQLARLHLKRQ